MQWWIIYANGRPFGVYTDTLDEAVLTASVHLAQLCGGAAVAHISHAVSFDEISGDD